MIISTAVLCCDVSRNGQRQSKGALYPSCYYKCATGRCLVHNHMESSADESGKVGQNRTVLQA